MQARIQLRPWGKKNPKRLEATVPGVHTGSGIAPVPTIQMGKLSIPSGISEGSYLSVGKPVIC